MAEWVERAKKHAYSVSAGTAMKQVLFHGLDILDVNEIHSEFGKSDYVVMKVVLSLDTAQQLEMSRAIFQYYYYGIET